MWHVLIPESLPNNCTAYSKKFFLDKNSSIGIIKKQYEIGFQIQMKHIRLRLMWIWGIRDYPLRLIIERIFL